MYSLVDTIIENNVGVDSMNKPMSKQMQKLADRYEKATWKKFDAKTNAQKIRAMTDEELAEFLSSITYGRETPWSEPFARRLCDSCPTVHGTYESGIEDDFHECDFLDGECPHGSAIVWWLKQPAEEEMLNEQGCRH